MDFQWQYDSDKVTAILNPICASRLDGAEKRHMGRHLLGVAWQRVPPAPPASTAATGGDPIMEVANIVEEVRKLAGASGTFDVTPAKNGCVNTAQRAQPLQAELERRPGTGIPKLTPTLTGTCLRTS